MTTTVGWLRQLSTGGVNVPLLSPYALNQGQEVFIGREPSCGMALNPQLYAGVSRRHALLRPSLQSGSSIWEVVDQNSANGIYVNGQKINQVRVLQTGDRIKLGENGPEFVIEYDQHQIPTVATNSPSGNASTVVSTPPLATPSFNQTPTPQNLAKNRDNLTLTQLIPIISTGKDLKKKAFLIPASLTVIFVILMFATIGEFEVFALILAFYIAGIAFYFIYHLCGKNKPWWYLIGCAISTMILLLTPVWSLFDFIFRQILPGDVFGLPDDASFFSHLIANFFGAGMAEELLKALPIFGALCFGLMLTPKWRSKLGVEEPLDGILIGTASAVGFTLLETLFQYVPDIVEQAGESEGLQLLIPRVLGAVAGHMAYSGYFGYFIGLCALKPRQTWLILPIGYLSSSLLHGLWNATISVPFGLIISAIVGIISYAFLGAAILKARALSPHRSENFATQIVQNK
jgi:RsiW-degrading membrane proteinase PrsW (M82 family)